MDRWKGEVHVRKHFLSCKSSLSGQHELYWLGTSLLCFYSYLYCYAMLQCSYNAQEQESLSDYYAIHIKTHGRVSVAKKAVWRTSVLFTGTTNLPFSIPISLKFIYFISSIYATPHAKFEDNQPNISWDMCYWKLPHIFLVLLHIILQK